MLDMGHMVIHQDLTIGTMILKSSFKGKDMSNFSLAQESKVYNFLLIVLPRIQRVAGFAILL